MKKLIVACVGLLWLYSGNGLALSDEQVGAVKDLGRLNGIALHCGYFDQTKVMKKNLIESVPKRRELGLAFDEASNDSFLAFIASNKACPRAADLAEEVSQTLRDIRKKFASQ